LKIIKFIFLIVCSFFSLASYAQPTVKVAGSALDEHDNTALSFVRVKIKELPTVQIQTDSSGRFLINLNKGAYHFTLQNASFAYQEFFVAIDHDTTLIFLIEKHHDHSLEEVIARGTRSSIAQHKISAIEQRRNFGLQLADVINSQAGVSSTKSNGSTSKPMIHGFANNRLSVLINGQTLSSQRWGFDHAPEVDAMQYAKISVLTGSQGLQVQDNTYGGAIRIDQLNINNEPHLHGAITAAVQTNGRRGALAITLEQAKQKWKYRLQASAKRGGDFHTPNYFLSNTGSQEINASIFLQQINIGRTKQWQKSAYYSLVSNKFGVLLGTQVSNLTDLQAALNSSVPFGTRSAFTYGINEPNQLVQHHFLQAKWFKEINEHTKKFINVNTQLNWRREYDVRRGFYSDKPNLSVLLQTVNAEYGIEKHKQKLSYKSAIQTRIQNNVNAAGTGIVPIVPNYFLSELGAYSIFTKDGKTIDKEISARADAQHFIAYPYLSNVYKSAVKTRFRGSLAANLRYQQGNFKLASNSIFAVRNPEINELFSYGLHQGIAAIEEGNAALKNEIAFNNILEMKYKSASDVLSISVSPYANLISNYVYLQGTNELRLTIRGAFPVFAYKQTQALLHGLDVQTILHLSPFEIENTISIIRGRDLSNNIWLPFMPADRIDAKCSYVLPKIKGEQIGSLYIKHRFVAEQTRFSPIQDYQLPPAAYNLWHTGIDANFNISGHQCSSSLIAENLFNTVYKDYLNRARYFAQDEGRNVRLVLKYSF
jgi:iron complex outermembrane recepter protein